MKSDLFKSWCILLVLQALVSLLVFSEFLSGNFYFAYLDIGSDSYFQVVPYAMYLARTVAQQSFDGWSFHIGLGGPTSAMFGDMTSMLVQSVSANRILPSRIWFYILKIILGGSFFLLFIRCYVTHWESAVICALSYSFCGYMVIDGQWDIQATAFVFYPFILWALIKHLQTGNLVLLPVSIGLALWFGTFFVSLGVFLIFTCIIFVGCSDTPRVAAKQWILRVFPLVAIGFLLAAPYLLPVIFQLIDSSRVSGSESHIHRILSQCLSVNDTSLILAEIGGLFHKDIFGIGSAYKGYFNYLEGPGFFVGVLLMLLIPQAWQGARLDRKLVTVSAIGITGYILFPVFRFAAMGFAAPYFRISTLWVSIALLTLAARALDLVICRGIKVKPLAFGVAAYGALLSVVLLGQLGDRVWMPHVAMVCGLALVSAIVLVLVQKNLLTQNKVPLVLMSIVAIEIIVIARPSYIEGRTMVPPELRAYDDGTPAALRAIREMDSGIFRVEKTFNSVSLADSLAQDYMGIKSYSLHSRGLVDFFIGTGLIAPTSDVPNFTNWLPNAGTRYMLNSLLGVKYMISRSSLNWPGFQLVRNVDGLQIYRNDFALPIGVVQINQITRAELSKLAVFSPANANTYRDAVMINSVVVDEIIAGHGLPFDLDELLRSTNLSLRDNYITPAQRLQSTGLRIDQFSNIHIRGSVSPNQSGVLVFSIPFDRGWALKIDGVNTQTIRANFGMLAAPIVSGQHSVELDYQTPGRFVGWLLGALGAALLVLAYAIQSRLLQS